MDGSDILKKVTGAIQKANNILVTINRSPSVDQVAAAIGLTFILERLDKFTTAIFSGELPSATEFLNPNQTFESNVDVLRDFIITINKEKVDRVRYKVEGDVVRILVTPYKTTLSAEDMNYDDGEYNVDLVIALGAVSQNDLDDSVRGVTRILHDATVLAINNTRETPNFATIAWNDERETSYCEMVADLAEVLGENEMNEAAATALLTGIISETDQFRNGKTTSKSLQVAAKLMGYGANQQLISVKLEESKNVLSQQETVATTIPEPRQAIETAPAIASNAVEIENPTTAEAVPETNAEAPMSLSREEILQNINKSISNANSAPVTPESVVATEQAENSFANIMDSGKFDTIAGGNGAANPELDLTDIVPPSLSQNNVLDDLAKYKAPTTVEQPGMAPAIEHTSDGLAPTESAGAAAQTSGAVNIESFVSPGVGTSDGLPMPPAFGPAQGNYIDGIMPAGDQRISDIEENLPAVKPLSETMGSTQNSDVSNTQFRIPGQ